MTRRKPPSGQLFDTTARPVPRVRRYVDRQIRAQRDTGQLEPVDDGLVGVVMTMADTIDREVADVAGSAWTILAGCGKLADVLIRLRGEPVGGGDDGPDVELAALVAAIRDAARPDP